MSTKTLVVGALIGLFLIGLGGGMDEKGVAAVLFIAMGSLIALAVMWVSWAPSPVRGRGRWVAFALAFCAALGSIGSFDSSPGNSPSISLGKGNPAEKDFAKSVKKLMKLRQELRGAREKQFKTIQDAQLDGVRLPTRYHLESQQEIDDLQRRFIAAREAAALKWSQAHPSEKLPKELEGE